LPASTKAALAESPTILRRDWQRLTKKTDEAKVEMDKLAEILKQIKKNRETGYDPRYLMGRAIKVDKKINKKKFFLIIFRDHSTSPNAKSAEENRLEQLARKKFKDISLYVFAILSVPSSQCSSSSIKADLSANKDPSFLSDLKSDKLRSFLHAVLFLYVF